MTLAEKLDRYSEPYIEGRCRLWLGALSNGYGRVRWQGRMIYAHRAAWECERGPIPEGLDVLHRCDNPPCRNVDHLFLGTNDDNVADMVAKGRQARVQGEAHGSAKLTDAQVIEIRAIPSDVPHYIVAAMHGIGPAQACDIRRRKKWTHLPP